MVLWVILVLRTSEIGQFPHSCCGFPCIRAYRYVYTISRAPLVASHAGQRMKGATSASCNSRNSTFSINLRSRMVGSSSYFYNRASSRSAGHYCHQGSLLFPPD